MTEEKFYTLRKDDPKMPVRFDLIGISYCDESYYIRRRKSSQYILEYIIEGEGTVEIEEYVYHPKKGDVYFLPRDIPHVYYSSKKNPWTKIWVNIKGPMVDYLASNYELGYYFENLDIYDEMKSIISIAKKSNDVLAASEIIFKIFNKMYSSAQNRKKYALSDMIKDYIDANITGKITIEDMSHYVGKSPSQITKVFKATYNITPYEYLIKTKINLSKNLLKNTSLTIKEIAERLSFTDEYYFSNIFKKRVGISPKFYRNK